VLENQVLRIGKPCCQKINHCVASPLQDFSVLLFFIRFCKSSVDFAPPGKKTLIQIYYTAEHGAKVRGQGK